MFRNVPECSMFLALSTATPGYTEACLLIERHSEREKNYDNRIAR